MGSDHQIPPGSARRFLGWFLRDDLAEEVHGDLEEQYRKKLSFTSPFRAKLNYWYQVINYLRPFAIRNTRSISLNINFTDMFRHNLLISFRNFGRYKTSFFINIISLTTGLACTIMIYLWVQDEFGVDRFHEKESRLYEVMQNFEDPGGIHTGTGTPGILAGALAGEIPEVAYATEMVPASWFASKGILTTGDARVRAAAQYIDTSYFDVFTCPFIRGDQAGTLESKNNIAISESLAAKLFPENSQAIGKMVQWTMDQFTGLFQITGIFKDPPPNSTLQFDLLVNYEWFLESHPWLLEWGNSDPDTYIVLREDADPDAVSAKIHDFVKSKYAESNQTLFIQKFSDRYLHGHYENGRPVGGRIEYVRLFSIIAVFVLIIASINFMNLSTAKASRRLKEVGIKKAIGAGRRTLVLQYIEEAMLMAGISMVIAIWIVIGLLPAFNRLADKHLSFGFSADIMVPLVLIMVFTGILAGSYPALYLSGFRPAEVLKGKLSGTIGDFWARKGLVIFQFAVSVILIVTVIVIYRQIEYVQSKNLGYDRDNILHFDLEVPESNDPDYFEPGGTYEQYVETFLSEIKNISGVVHAANYFHDLTGNHGGLGGVDWEAGNQDEQNIFSNLEVGYDFISSLGIGMASGRNFSREFASDRSAIIFNESAIRLMGLENPVGRTIRLWGREKHIVGVTRDFNFESLYQHIKPCLFQLEPRGYKILVKIRHGAEKETIAGLRKLFESRYPGLAFSYSFVDQDYQALYASEQRISVISRYFSLIGIVISGLGLFGLAAFTAERRVKEIGIRKIMGARPIGIVGLLTTDFTKMVLAGVLVAMPVSYMIARNWLNDFAYRVDLQWWYFAGAGLSVLLVAWIAVGYQTLHAAGINPVKCLRDE